MAQLQRKKMLWYYTAIIDWMIANPGRPLSECAAHVGKAQSTLSIIINSDMFKAALAQRKAEFQARHDFGLIEKTTRIANAGLDAILMTLENKKDKVPLQELNTVTEGALARLGYGVKAQTPSVQVNVNGNGPTQVVLPVSAQDLAEARMALRQVQENTRSLPAPIQEPRQVEAEPRPMKTIEGEVSNVATSSRD